MKTIKIYGIDTELTEDPIRLEGQEISEDTTCGICYGELEEGDDTSIGEHINPENYQKIAISLCHKECLDDDATERALTVTSQHHDWGHTLADDFVSSVTADTTDDEFEVLAEDFREKAKALSHSVYDVAEKVEEIIEDEARYREDAE